MSDVTVKLADVPSVTAEPPDIVRIGAEEARSVPFTRIMKAPGLPYWVTLGGRSAKTRGNDHLPERPIQSRSSSTRQPNFPVSPPSNALERVIFGDYILSSTF